MANDQDQILEKQLSKREVPVEFGAVGGIVVGDELAEKACLFSEEDDIPESIVPFVFCSAEVVKTGKGARKLALAEKLTMEMNLLFLYEWLLIEIGTVDKDFVAINGSKKE